MTPAKSNVLRAYPTAVCKKADTIVGRTYGIFVRLPGRRGAWINGCNWMTPAQAWERASAALPRWKLRIVVERDTVGPSLKQHMINMINP